MRGTDELNDEKAGDILEAIWGVLWNRKQIKQRQEDQEDFWRTVLSDDDLKSYCDVMTKVVQLFVDFIAPLRMPTQYHLSLFWGIPCSQVFSTL